MINIFFKKNNIAKTIRKGILLLVKKIVAPFYYTKVTVDLVNVTGHGERFDPNILTSEFMSRGCVSHINRYKFALKHDGGMEDIVDLACGTGWGSYEIARKNTGANVIGVDISLEAIEFARNNYSLRNLNFVNSDLFSYDVKSDLLVSFETIEHIDHELNKTLEHLISLANKVFIGSVPYMEPEGHNDFHKKFMLNEDSFAFLKNNGELTFYYQNTCGMILKNKMKNIHNLIFVLRK